MSKKVKVFSVGFVALCLILQIFLVSSAVTEGSYSVFMPNNQEKVQLISGTNASSQTPRTYMSFTGGSANYIYVQTQLDKVEITPVTSGWMKLEKSDSFYSIYYTSSQPAGTRLRVMGYQKNIFGKTASGFIYI